jgi:amidase
MDLVFSSATQLAGAIRSRSISAAEVVDAHLSTIDRRNSALNAVVTIDADGAHDRARQADEALARDVTWGPLHGVPFTLKDAFATAGMRTTVGFSPLDHVPREDSTVAARLKAAGGILVGKTNVAQLLADFQTSNPIFGRSNNPWNLARTPGGSSGGAAAAVASGMTPFDVGTDLSGSIRIPAHFCGVFGFKPTEHRVSLAGVVPDPRNSPRTVRIMSSVGPIARTVDDLALVYSIIAGPDPRDTDVPPVSVDQVRDLDPAQLRIAVAPSLGGFPVETDIRDAIEALARRLAQSGMIVDQADLPLTNFTQELSEAGALIGSVVGAAQPGASTPSLPVYMQALQRRDTSIAAWDEFFDRWDALLCPPCMTSAFPHCAPGSPLAVNGATVDYWMVSAHTAIFNYSGHPAVVLPCGLDRSGLPLSVQLVSKRWSDSRLLGIAKLVAELCGGFQPPP